MGVNMLSFVSILLVFLLVLAPASPVKASEIPTLRTKRPGVDKLGYYPENDEIVRVNPPYFLWMEERDASWYELELSEDEDFETKEVFTNIPYSMMLFHKPLNQDTTYYWRYRYFDKEGNPSLFSETRAFSVSKTADLFFIPPLDEIKARIPDHPRLFVTKNNIQEIRDKREDIVGEILWDSIYWDGKKVISARPPSEPEGFPGGIWDVTHWGNMQDITLRAVDPLEKAAFAYVITKEEDLGLAAKEWLIEVAKWDPLGPTSAAVNDECSMNILYRMSRAYTWLYDLLSTEDKLIVQNSIRLRGEEVYNLLTATGKEYHNSPYNSHLGRQIAFLGEAAIAFLGEIDEAEKWFDYVTQVFFSIYPAWGGEDGGWAEGPIYWRWYMERILWFADAYYQATGVNLVDKPFFQKTGYFKLFVHPPYAEHSPFGDNLDEIPNKEDFMVMNYLAKYADNPYFKWYSKQLKGMIPDGIIGFLWYENELELKEPVDLPQSRFFRDVGWVSMHTDLADGYENIHVLFKSSPYGSYSHSHADQNAFTIEAFGTPLIISSGYYPYYGSPHHTEWTNQTISKSTILVDGTGQPINSLTAKGEIKDFISTNALDYTLGDANKAYGSKLRQYDRQILFIKPHFLLIYDELEAPRESSFEWLLHARKEFQITENKIKVEDGSAKLIGEINSTLPLKLSATNKFTVDPEERHANKPKQWHFKAETTEKAKEASFIAILVPQKKADTATYEAVFEDKAAKILYKNTETIALFTEKAFNCETNGRSASVTREDGEIVSLHIAGGRVLSEGSDTLLKLSREGSVSITIDKEKVSVSRDILEEGLTLTLKLDKAPSEVLRDKKPITSWQYLEEEKLLEITLE